MISATAGEFACEEGLLTYSDERGIFFLAREDGSDVRVCDKTPSPEGLIIISAPYVGPGTRKKIPANLLPGTVVFDYWSTDTVINGYEVGWFLIQTMTPGQGADHFIVWQK
jgi:hypothetical protein